MIDLRIWRTALLAAPLALIVAMFSLQEVPKPLEPDDTAGRLRLRGGDDARDATSPPQFPEAPAGVRRRRGPRGVRPTRFEEIPSAEVAEQSFEGSFDDEDVAAAEPDRSPCPGSSERQIAADRAARHGRGQRGGDAHRLDRGRCSRSPRASRDRATRRRSSSSRPTAAASAPSARGASSRDYTEQSLLDAAIVISQPAAPEPAPPFVIPWSSGPQSTSAALADTANATLSEEAGEPAGDPGPFERAHAPGSPLGPR